MKNSAATINQKEKESHLKPYDYRIGGCDNDGNKVVKIYASSPGYVVYRTENTIRIDLDDSNPKLNDYAENHYKIGEKLAHIYSLLPEKLDNTESINRLVARAMTLNVAGHFDKAINILNHAEHRLVKLLTIKGRLHYIVSAFCFAIILFFIAFFGSDSYLKESFQIIFFGALGGVLSIAVGYGSLRIDVDAGWHTNCTIGISRIIIAVIASLFLYFAIKANIIFSFVNTLQGNYGLFAFAMIAGFAEMLVPNIMNNLSKDSKISAE